MGKTLGKALVILNVIFSVGFASFAFAIYANRIPWAKVGGAGKPEIKGIVDIKKKEYDDLVKSIDASYLSCEAAKGKLLELEKKRPEDLQWYQEKMAELRNGKGVVLSIRHLEGKIVEEKGRPVLEDQYKAAQIGSLQPLDTVDQQRNQTEKNIEKTQKAIETAVARQKELSEEMNGQGDKFLGLRAILVEEKTAEKNALAEAEHLKPLRVNRQAEADLLIKRNRALEARVAELQK